MRAEETFDALWGIKLDEIWSKLELKHTDTVTCKAISACLCLYTMDAVDTFISGFEGSQILALPPLYDRMVF